MLSASMGGWQLAALFCGLSLACAGQNESESFLQADLVPSIDLVRYETVTFNWNMDGKTQVSMNEGLNNLSENKLVSATENFKEVVRQAPRFYAGHYYLGVCYKMDRKFRDAIKELEQALKLNDTLAAAQIELGEIYESARFFDKAETNYIKAANQKSGQISAYLHLGSMELRKGQQEKARKRYLTCLDYDSRSSEARNALGILALTTKNKREAIQYFSDALTFDSLSGKNLFWRGLVYLEDKDYKKCLIDFDRLVRHNPMNTLYVFLRGYAYAADNEFDAAFSDFRKSFSMIDVNEDKFEGAQTMLDKRIDLQTAGRYLMSQLYGFPDGDMKYIKRGFCLLITGHYQNAFNILRAVEKPSGIVMYLQGLAFEHAGLHKEALNNYDKALALDPKIYDAYKKRGIYRMELKQYENAINDFTQMTVLFPDLVIGFRLRGIANTLRGEYASAINDLSRFLAVDSTNAEAFTTRGVCYESLSDWKHAGADFKSALSLQENNDILDHALADYQKAIDKDPNDLEVKFNFGVLHMQYVDYNTGLKMVKTCRDKGYQPAAEFLIREKERRTSGR